MPVNVGEIVSTVTPEPEEGGQSAGGKQDWQHSAEMRQAMARLRMDRLRTSAEGFDD